MNDNSYYMNVLSSIQCCGFKVSSLFSFFIAATIAATISPQPASFYPSLEDKREKKQLVMLLEARTCKVICREASDMEETLLTISKH